MNFLLLSLRLFLYSVIYWTFINFMRYEFLSYLIGYPIILKKLSKFFFKIVLILVEPTICRLNIHCIILKMYFPIKTSFLSLTYCFYTQKDKQ